MKIMVKITVKITVEYDKENVWKTCNFKWIFTINPYYVKCVFGVGNNF